MGKLGGWGAKCLFSGPKFPPSYCAEEFENCLWTKGNIAQIMLVVGFGAFYPRGPTSISPSLP